MSGLAPCCQFLGGRGPRPARSPSRNAAGDERRLPGRAAAGRPHSAAICGCLELLRPWRRWLAMEKLSHLVENAFMIAWEYLEATGELGEADGAGSGLLDILHKMIRT